MLNYSFLFIKVYFWLCNLVTFFCFQIGFWEEESCLENFLGSFRLSMQHFQFLPAQRRSCLRVKVHVVRNSFRSRQYHLAEWVRGLNSECIIYRSEPQRKRLLKQTTTYSKQRRLPEHPSPLLSTPNWRKRDHAVIAIGNWDAQSILIILQSWSTPECEAVIWSVLLQRSAQLTRARCRLLGGFTWLVFMLPAHSSGNLLADFWAHLSCSAFTFAETIVVFYDFVPPVFHSPAESWKHLHNASCKDEQTAQQVLKSSVVL